MAPCGVLGLSGCGEYPSRAEVVLAIKICYVQWDQTNTQMNIKDMEVRFLTVGNGVANIER